jgi:hypothetical protein
VQVADQTGIFKGLGDNGEAIVQDDKSTHRLISGSLRYIE